MKIRSIASTVVFLLVFSEICSSQVNEEEVLMTVAGRKVTAGEFIRMYNKGPDSSENMDLNKYLDQFIVFKLKVAEAIEMGTDTTKAFKTELQGYRNQLAETYLSDPDIKEQLVQKAYQRSLLEIKASHILVSCPPDAAPSDTMKAYKKAMELRERILGGEQFEKVARETSDDKSAETNGGNLGYFTVFQMVRPFEDAAYSIEPGNISMPVRTSFGYHIIKITDKRPSKGKIKVAHIMKAFPRDGDEKKIKEAKDIIDTIYYRLEAGEPFKKLAAIYSDHRESALKGGELNWFGAGEIIPDFAEAAFSLIDTGSYTRPVRTVFGFHIIKLLDRKPPPSFDEMRPLIESKIRKSDLKEIERQSVINKLKKEYGFRVFQGPYRWFIKHTDSAVIKGNASYNLKKVPDAIIFSFADQNFSARDFAKEVEKRTLNKIPDNPKQFIDKYIEFLVSNRIISYENSILENKYPEFKYLIKEFHDGILLFDISSKKVWDKARDDSAGLHQYYEATKNNYLSKRAVKGKLYTLNIPGGLDQLNSAFIKYSSSPKTDSLMLKTFTSKGNTLLTITDKKWELGEDQYIDAIKWEPGAHSFVKDNIPSLIFVEKVIEPVPLPFKEVQADIISGYQDKLMAEWIKQLRDKYVVEINEPVYNEVKKTLRHE